MTDQQGFNLKQDDPISRDIRDLMREEVNEIRGMRQELRDSVNAKDATVSDMFANDPFFTEHHSERINEIIGSTSSMAPMNNPYILNNAALDNINLSRENYYGGSDMAYFDYDSYARQAEIRNMNALGKAENFFTTTGLWSLMRGPRFENGRGVGASDIKAQKREMGDSIVDKFLNPMPDVASIGADLGVGTLAGGLGFWPAMGMGALAGAAVGYGVEQGIEEIQAYRGYREDLINNSWKIINPYESNNKNKNMGFSDDESKQMARMLAGMNSKLHISDKDFKEIFGGLMDNSLLTGASDMESFEKTVKTMAETVKRNAIALKKTSDEITQMMGELKMAGLDPNDMGQYFASIKGISSVTGLDPSQSLSYLMANMKGKTTGSDANPENIFYSEQGLSREMGKTWDAAMKKKEEVGLENLSSAERFYTSFTNAEEMKQWASGMVQDLTGIRQGVPGGATSLTGQAMLNYAGYLDEEGLLRIDEKKVQDIVNGKISIYGRDGALNPDLIKNRTDLTAQQKADLQESISFNGSRTLWDYAVQDSSGMMKIARQSVESLLQAEYGDEWKTWKSGKIATRYNELTGSQYGEQDMNALFSLSGDINGDATEIERSLSVVSEAKLNVEGVRKKFLSGLRFGNFKDYAEYNPSMVFDYTDNPADALKSMKNDLKYYGLSDKDNFETMSRAVYRKKKSLNDRLEAAKAKGDSAAIEKITAEMEAVDADLAITKGQATKFNQMDDTAAIIGFAVLGEDAAIDMASTVKRRTDALTSGYLARMEGKNPSDIGWKQEEIENILEENIRKYADDFEKNSEDSFGVAFDRDKILNDQNAMNAYIREIMKKTEKAGKGTSANEVEDEFDIDGLKESTDKHTANFKRLTDAIVTMMEEENGAADKALKFIWDFQDRHY